MKAALALALLVGAGCVTTDLGGRPFAPSRFTRESGWTAVRGVPLVLQRRELDCGAAAITMVLRFWQRPTTVDEVRAESGMPDSRGLQAGWLRDLVRGRGLEAFLIEGSLDDLAHELAAGRPVLVGVARGRVAHYQVVIGLDRARGRLVVMDPAGGWLEYELDRFTPRWNAARRLALVVLQPAETSSR